MHRAVNEDRVVAGDLDRHTLGRFLQLGDGGRHAGGNIQRVGFGLANDADADAGLAVRAQRGLADVGTERYRGDVADACRARC
jgi:hypothetical protein